MENIESSFDFNLMRFTFYDIYRNVLAGKISYPRGLKIFEIQNFYQMFKPYWRFTNFKNRNLNLDYIKREFMWYLNGDKFDLSICNYAKMWNKFIREDGIIYSNYGQYIFGELNQFIKAYETLAEDKDSRRACIIILQPYHIIDINSKEIPCTYSISFLIRENKLDMIVRMRSQDSWYGFASDIPCFSFIHEMMYIMLKDSYSDLHYGNYHHYVDSFHIYESQVIRATDIVIDGIETYQKVYCPKISSKDEVLFLMSREFQDIEYDRILVEYKFSKWLVSAKYKWHLMLYDSNNYIWDIVSDKDSYDRIYLEYLKVTNNQTKFCKPEDGDYYTIGISEDIIKNSCTN